VKNGVSRDLHVQCTHRLLSPDWGIRVDDVKNNTTRLRHRGRFGLARVAWLPDCVLATRGGRRAKDRLVVCLYYSRLIKASVGRGTFKVLHDVRTLGIYFYAKNGKIAGERILLFNR